MIFSYTLLFYVGVIIYQWMELDYGYFLLVK